MTQEQKAAAWDGLMQVMSGNDMDAIVIEDCIRKRRMFWMFTAWMTVEVGAEPGTALYEGPDPLAALAALTAEAAQS